MASFILYDLATNIVKGFGSCPDPEIGIQTPVPGQGLVIGELPDKRDFTDYYMLGSTPFLRPTIPPLAKSTIIANGTDSVRLAGLPDPCVMTINGAKTTITGGFVDFTSDAPVTMELSISQLPYFDWSATLVAVPA